MTTSIYWQPTQNHGVPLQVGGAPSTFIDNIKKVFGDFPATLDQDDIPKLEALSALYDGNMFRPYAELIDAITTSGSINLTATY